MSNTYSRPDFNRKSSAGGKKNNSGRFKAVVALLLAVIAVLVVILVTVSRRGNSGNNDPVAINTVTPGSGATSVPATHAPTNVPEAPVKDSIVLDVGETIPNASAFLKEGSENLAIYYLSSIAGIDTRVPGEYQVSLQCGEQTYNGTIIVRDTVPPTAEVRDLTVAKGTEVKPEDFIVSINDQSEVKVEFTAPVNTDGGGTKEVGLKLTDAGGNVTLLTATLTVDVDTTPPVITAIEYREVYLGQTVSYREGLSVTDDHEGEVSVSIDSSNVNLKQAGTYTVIYTARDASGNVSTFTAKIAVIDPTKSDDYAVKYSEASMHIIYSRIRDEIIKDGMNEIEKLFAIWNYVKDHLSYVDYSDKDSYVRESIRGLEEGTGDCFTYYSCMRALMEETGFETLEVQRIVQPGRTAHHYWSLVKVGGEWYHIDATPRSEKRVKYWMCFLRTDDEMLRFGEGRDDYEIVNYYYTFDTSLTPPSGTKRIAEVTVDPETKVRTLTIF